MDTQKTEVEIDDLYLASFLHAKGVAYLGIRKTNTFTGRRVFIFGDFADKPVVEKLVADWKSGLAEDFKKILSSNTILRNILREEKAKE